MDDSGRFFEPKWTLLSQRPWSIGFGKTVFPTEVGKSSTGGMKPPNVRFNENNRPLSLILKIHRNDKYLGYKGGTSATKT